MDGALSPLRAYARSAGSLAVLHVASLGIALAIGMVLARQLGAAGYGIYGLAMAVATLAGMTAELGLPNLTMREVAAARANEQWNLVLGLEIWSVRVVLLLSLALALIVFALHLFTGLAEGSAFMAAMLWAVLLIPAVAVGKLRGMALLAIGHTFAGQFPVLVLRPALFLLVLAAIWAAGVALDAPAAMAIQAGAALLTMIAVIVAWRRYRPEGMRQAEPAFASREWTAVCIPMAATEGLRLLQGQGAILLLGLLATAHDAGVFRVADSIVLVTALGQAVLQTAAAPHFARLKAAGDHIGLQRILSATALAMTASTIALGLPVALLGGDLLAFLFGEEFRQSYHPFMLAWLAMIAFGAFGPVQVYANMAGHQKLVTICFVLGVVTNVAISAIAIPRLGAVGAALGLLASVCLSNAWLWWQILSRDKLNSAVFAPGVSKALSLKAIRRVFTR